MLGGTKLAGHIIDSATQLHAATRPAISTLLIRWVRVFPHL
jgi:hypothetical protein